MKLVQADIRDGLPLPDNSIDMIFTDPPYPTEYLSCYAALAREAMRVLRPGGFVMAMCGGLNLPKIYRYFEDSGLDYFYEMQSVANGQAPTVWRRIDGKNYPIVAKAKPILVYSKGASRPRVGGVMNWANNPKDNGKNFHEWGQDIETARYYIDYFSRPGDIVLDPFIGGGTTAVACELIRRECIGMDIDPVAIQTTRDRLAETDIYHNLPMFAGAQP